MINNMNNFQAVNNNSNIDISEFTNDQKKAYNELLNFINSPFNEKDFKRGLIGPAGTGKTYLIKALITNCSLSYSIIGLTAFAHKACRVLKESIGKISCECNTLASDLGLRPNFNAKDFNPSNPPFDPFGRIKIKDYKLYIIDEASMINSNLISFIEKVCKNNKCKIIYIGDDHQLPPINENKITAFLTTKSYKLTEIVRQDKDNPINSLLELLRYDIDYKKFKFLEYISKYKEKFDADNIKGYKVCTENEFNAFVYNNFNDERITKDIDFARIIAYTNINVSYWNKLVRNAIIKDANKNIITKNDLILSYITIVNQFNESIIENSEEYVIRDIVNYTHPTYNLKGFMVTFAAIHGGKQTMPLFIIDHSDNFTLQSYIKISNDLINIAQNSSPSTRGTNWKTYFKFKESCLLLCNIAEINNNGNTVIKYGRNLDYGFALTAHKAQGSTYDTVLVDVNDIVFDKYGKMYKDVEEINRRLYVAISRCKNKCYLKFG